MHVATEKNPSEFTCPEAASPIKCGVSLISSAFAMGCYRFLYGQQEAIVRGHRRGEVSFHMTVHESLESLGPNVETEIPPANSPHHHICHRHLPIIHKVLFTQASSRCCLRRTNRLLYYALLPDEPTLDIATLLHHFTIGQKGFKSLGICLMRTQRMRPAGGELSAPEAFRVPFGARLTPMKQCNQC